MDTQINYEVNFNLSVFKFLIYCKEEPDDDVNDFIKGFDRNLKIWVLLSALHFIQEIVLYLLKRSSVFWFCKFVSRRPKDFFCLNNHRPLLELFSK